MFTSTCQRAPRIGPPPVGRQLGPGIGAKATATPKDRRVRKYRTDAPNITPHSRGEGFSLALHHPALSHAHSVTRSTIISETCLHINHPIAVHSGSVTHLNMLARIPVSRSVAHASMPVAASKPDIKIAEDERDLENVAWSPQFPLINPGSRLASRARIRGGNTA